MKSWKATPKKQCTKCQIIFDKDWTSADRSCPSCHAHECHQRTIRASDSRARRFTPITDVQRRIVAAETRLKELNLIRMRFDSAPLFGVVHSADMDFCNNEIIKNTLYLSELQIKLRSLVEQNENSDTIRVQACV